MFTEHIVHRTMGKTKERRALEELQVHRTHWRGSVAAAAPEACTVLWVPGRNAVPACPCSMSDIQ